MKQKEYKTRIFKFETLKDAKSFIKDIKHIKKIDCAISEHFTGFYVAVRIEK